LGNSQEFKDATTKFSSRLLKNAVISDSLIECVQNASTVIGKESAGLIACAYKGKNIFLIPDGNNNSFQIMFPDTNLLK